MHSSCVVALDVGGTAMKGAVVETDGDQVTVRARKSYATDPEAGYDAVVERIGDAFEELAALAPGLGLEAPSAAGLAVPGIVDDRRGVAVVAANLPFENAPLVAPLAARLGIPVALGHDVRAGGLAESVQGAAKGAENSLFLPLGTGIAGAFIVDGRPIVAGGYVGEIGHIAVEPDGEPCPCGGRGCLERVASASGVARRYARRAGVTVDGAADVAARVRAGDPIAEEVWDEAVDALARALHTAVTLLGPEVVVIGGGLAESGELLLEPLRSRLDAALTFQRRPTVTRAVLGDQAGCLGAALLARDLRRRVARDADGGAEGSRA
ncbi:MAG TPA: ROK family protein [Actinopolymorphaceae bacterium]